MVLQNSTKGIAAVAVAGISNGSFPAPSKGITNWKWEHIWFVYSFWAMALLPIGLALLFGRGVIPRLLADEPSLSGKVAIFGALWGVGSLLFGVSLVRLGMAITNSLVNGVVVFLGSLGPILIGAVRLGPIQLVWLIGGLALLALSLALCAGASLSRDREQGISSSGAASARRSIGAIGIAVLAGILSSMLNIGFVYGAPLADKAKSAGCPQFLSTVAIWAPALLGGLVINMGYPAYLMFKRNSWSTLLNGNGNIGAWLGSSFMGVLWFGAILLYGIGASTMGHGGAVYGWALIIAVSILTSNAWGALTGEWKGSGFKPKLLMWLSTLVLIGSLILLAGQQMNG